LEEFLALIAPLVVRLTTDGVGGGVCACLASFHITNTFCFLNNIDSQEKNVVILALEFERIFALAYAELVGNTLALVAGGNILSFFK